MATTVKPSYFDCAKRDIPGLIERAQGELAKILKDLQYFYTIKDLEVKIYPVDHVYGFSIAASLWVNGAKVREYDAVDLCFLDLHSMMFGRMLELRKDAL